MSKCKFSLPLVVLALVAVLAVAAMGCAPARPATPAVPPATPAPPVPPAPVTPPPAPPAPPPSNVPLPVVVYFTSTAEKLPPGTIAILIWNVTGADSVVIDNGVGKVEPQGRVAIMPSATVTFTLTATSRGGSVNEQVMIEVLPSLASSPGFRPGYTLAQVQMQAVVGSPSVIKQDTMTSKGYRWVVDYYDPAMLKYVGSNYIEKNPLTYGVDGQTQFTFEPLDKGDTRVLVSNINDATPTKFDSIIYNIRVMPR